MLAAAGLAAPYGKLRHDIGQQAPVLGTPEGLGPRDPAVAISQKYFAPEISEGLALRAFPAQALADQCRAEAYRRELRGPYTRYSASYGGARLRL